MTTTVVGLQLKQASPFLRALVRARRLDTGTGFASELEALVVRAFEREGLPDDGALFDEVSEELRREGLL